MISKHFPNHFTRTICIAGISMGLLSACLAQAPTEQPTAVYATATPTNVDLPTSTPSPNVQKLQVADWQISSFNCDKNGTVANVTVEVTVEGGTLPYAYTTEGFVESNPSGAKHVAPTDAQPTAASVKKPKNATATPTAPTNTPLPLLVTMPPLLPGQLLINLQPGVEKITIRSADGQSVMMEVFFPSACSDLSLPTNIPVGTLSFPSSPQPSATATIPSPVNNLPRRPVCSDGLDNDGDGYVDLHDRNCKNKHDQDESH
jgi:hypothetical protein